MIIEADIVTSGVEERQIERVRPPESCSLDETAAGQVAANSIRELDKHYNRNQVHAIAHWMYYLSTQQ